MAGNSDNKASREVIYHYLLEQMKQGYLLPGSVLNLSEISKKLNISNTPLRDTLIKLEAEGFLTIYPRSKVVINSLELEDFPFLYSTIGTLEYTLITTALDKYTPEIIKKLRELNQEMRVHIQNGDLMLYDRVHYDFHNIFVKLNRNLFAERIIRPIKYRLWDFPRKNLIKDWYENAISEHEQLIDVIEKKDLSQIENIIKNFHWGYEYNKDYIIKAYNL